MAPDQRPGTEPVAIHTRGCRTYATYAGRDPHASGELWTTGEHGGFCGYVEDPKDIEVCIDMYVDERMGLVAAEEDDFCSNPPSP